MILPEKLRRLDVRIGGEPGGELWQQSQLLFKYLRDDPAQAAVGLLMPPTRLLYQSNSLFPVMDQNLPSSAKAAGHFSNQPSGHRADAIRAYTLLSWL